MQVTEVNRPSERGRGNRGERGAGDRSRAGRRGDPLGRQRLLRQCKRRRRSADHGYRLGIHSGDQIEIDGTGVFALTNADANGNISVTTQGPILDKIGPGTETFALTANDQTALVTNPIAQTSVTMANLAVSTSPSSAKPTTKVRWRASGFRPGRLVYAHYVHRGHAVATARLGRAKGACGLMSVKAMLYPNGHPRYTTYKLQIDSARRYSAHASPKVVNSLTIFRF